MPLIKNIAPIINPITAFVPKACGLFIKVSKLCTKKIQVIAKITSNTPLILFFICRIFRLRQVFAKNFSY